MEFGFNRGCKGRCQDNRFWDFTRCKWPLTGDDNMGISYEGWLVFSTPTSVSHCTTHCRNLADTIEPSVCGGDAPYVKLL